RAGPCAAREGCRGPSLQAHRRRRNRARRHLDQRGHARADGGAQLDRSAAGLVTPVLLREPMAPHIAASREGRTLTLDPVRAAFDRIKDSFVVAEGVGGFLVPLSDSLDTVDLCRALGLPVVLVVGMRLGCLNHALLTANAIAASGMPFAGWIANRVDREMLAADENLFALESRLDARLLG